MPLPRFVHALPGVCPHLYAGMVLESSYMIHRIILDDSMVKAGMSHGQSRRVRASKGGWLADRYGLSCHGVGEGQVFGVEV